MAGVWIQDTVDLLADGRLWSATYLNKRLVVYAADRKHFMIDGRTVFTFNDAESSTAKEVSVVRVAYCVLETIALEPIKVNTPGYHANVVVFCLGFITCRDGKRMTAARQIEIDSEWRSRPLR